MTDDSAVWVSSAGEWSQGCCLAQSAVWAMGIEVCFLCGQDASQVRSAGAAACPG